MTHATSTNHAADELLSEFVSRLESHVNEVRRTDDPAAILAAANTAADDRASPRRKLD